MGESRHPALSLPSPDDDSAEPAQWVMREPLAWAL